MYLNLFISESIMRNLKIAIFALFFIAVTDSYTHPKCRMLNGYEGECRYLDKCKPLFELNEKLVKTELELLFLRQSTCGISSSYRYKVCCPPQSEWWRELEVSPVLFPELVNYMNDRVPNLGPNRNKVPGTTSSTINPTPWKPNQGTNFGQAQGAKRPPPFDQTITNTNSYGYDDFPQKPGQTPFVNPTTKNPNPQGFNNNNGQNVGQTNSNGQNAWNYNNLGFGNNPPRRTERPPIQNQFTTNINVNTNENDQSQRGDQMSTIGQTAGNANSQGFGNDQGQRVDQTPTVGQTWNMNDQGQKVDQTPTVGQTWNMNDQGQRVDQTPTVGQTWNMNDPSQNDGQTPPKRPPAFSEHPYKFDSIPPQKIQPTTTTTPNQVLPITNSQGFDNGQSQIVTQTTPKVQMDLSVTTEKNETEQMTVVQATSNDQIAPNANPQGFGNDQTPNVGGNPIDEQIALSVNIDDFENQPTMANAERCGVQAIKNSGNVGGEVAPEQYPWLALLEYSGGAVVCGGSLISRIHVLTAAHCVDTMRGNPTAVRLSEYNMTTYPVDMAASGDGNPRPIRITIVPVEWAKMHPQFHYSQYQHDIGIVKMTRQVDYTDFVRPICLPQTDYTKQFDVKTKLLVAGWGTDSSKIEEVKMDTQQSYVPIGICNRLVKRALNSKQMCAGERPPRRPCVGDYGGPLMLETNNAYIVVGVLSYGPNQCAGGTVPDVSTNVYEYLDWINANMVDTNDPPTTVES